LLGPHEPIPPLTGIAALQDTGRGEFESITAICTYRGFTTKKEGQVEWMREQEDAGESFFFYATGYNTDPGSIFHGTKKMWSDGIDHVTVNGDLPASSARAFPYIDVVADDLIESAMGVVYSGSGLTAGTRLPKWSDQHPAEGPFETDSSVPAGWVSNRLYSNKFIGRPPYREPDPDDPDPCYSPECVYVSLYTKSRKFNLSGTGIESDTVSFLTSTISGAQATIPKPKINLIEPFGVTVYIEPLDLAEYQENEWRKQPDGESPKSSGFDSYNHPLKRDGVSRYVAVAEITWRDEVVVGRAENPLPVVSWDVGTAQFSKEGMEFSRLEDRTVCPLDFDESQSYHLRTSFDSDHFHYVAVDDNGRGRTTKTVSYTKGVSIPDHEHTIDIYAAQKVAVATYSYSGVSDSHSHSLKSVAVVGIGPISDKTLSLAVKAVADYDDGKVQVDGSRVSRELDNYAFSYPSTADVETGESGYVLEIIPTTGQYVDGKVVSGFPARMHASDAGYTMLFHAYINTSGGEIPVADGTRIFADFEFYEYNDTGSKQEKDDNGIVVVGADDAPRVIAVLKTSAFIPGLPEELNEINKSMVTSDMHWFPSVQAPSLITKPETDSIIFEKTLESFSEIGPSRLNDALALAARRMVTFSDYLTSSKKVVVVVSDGAESNSDLSYDQAVAELKSVDSEDPVELVFVKLERTELFDDLVVRKYTSELDGFPVDVSDVSDVDSIPGYVVDSIMDSPDFDLVTGWYSNIVDLGDGKLFTKISFSATLPDDSTLSFMVRFSDDGVNFGEWIQIGSGGEFDLLQYGKVSRYMEYRISFKGDPETFESPTVSSVGYEYYEPRRYTLMFQPMPVVEGKDGYVGEIIFAHYGDIPSTSTVSYGVKHSEGVDREWFWTEQQPSMKDGFGGIVLSRVNELLVRKDATTFTAAYGGWPSDYTVQVFRINDEGKYGVVVPEQDYTYDSGSGSFVFASEQPDSDVLTVTLTMRPYFRVAVDIVNKGPDSASLDYLGTMYRPVDRSFMYDNDRRPVYSALDTDFVKLGMEPSKTLSVSQVVYNNLVGTADDVFVDYAVSEGIPRVLGYSPDGIFMTSLRENFTVLDRNGVSGVTGVPVSCSYMDGHLYVCAVDEGEYTVFRLDDDYNAIYSFGAGTVDEHSGVIRSMLDLWYTTDGNTVMVRNRSFEIISEIVLSSRMSGRFHVGDVFSFVTEYGDAVAVYSSEGHLNAVYIVEERLKRENNVFVEGEALTAVSRTSLSTYK
jgi:hypothetical protein